MEEQTQRLSSGGQAHDYDDVPMGIDDRGSDAGSSVASSSLYGSRRSYNTTDDSSAATSFSTFLSDDASPTFTSKSSGPEAPS